MRDKPSKITSWVKIIHYSNKCIPHVDVSIRNIPICISFDLYLYFCKATLSHLAPCACFSVIKYENNFYFGNFDLGCLSICGVAVLRGFVWGTADELHSTRVSLCRCISQMWITILLWYVESLNTKPHYSHSFKLCCSSINNIVNHGIWSQLKKQVSELIQFMSR